MTQANINSPMTQITIANVLQSVVAATDSTSVVVIDLLGLFVGYFVEFKVRTVGINVGSVVGSSEGWEVELLRYLVGLYVKSVGVIVGN